MSDKDKDVPAIRRQLKIKSGVVRRLEKELGTYRKEAEAQQRKLDHLKADGTAHEDWEWNLKNGTRMMEESSKMIIDSVSRLQQAVYDLRTLVISATTVDELAQDEEFLKAKETLEVASS